MINIIIIIYYRGEKIYYIFLIFFLFFYFYKNKKLQKSEYIKLHSEFHKLQINMTKNNYRLIQAQFIYKVNVMFPQPRRKKPKLIKKKKKPKNKQTPNQNKKPQQKSFI